MIRLGEMTLLLVNVLVAVVSAGSESALFARSAPISLHDQCGLRGSLKPASRRAGNARPCRAELVRWSALLDERPGPARRGVVACGGRRDDAGRPASQSAQVQGGTPWPPEAGSGL